MPDDGPDDGRTIRWSAGALDGVLSRHGESTREPARGAELAALITKDIAAGRAPDARDLRQRLQPRGRDLPVDVPVTLTALASFDALLEAGA